MGRKKGLKLLSDLFELATFLPYWLSIGLSNRLKVLFSIVIPA